MYRENGYRDAKIIGYKTSFNNNGELLLNIELTEGEKYFFGDIKWIGNSKYDSEKLNELLSIKEGVLTQNY